MTDFTQPLPTQQPDLSTLFQYAPSAAYSQVGTQQRVADQNNQALQDAFANQEAFNQQKRPLDLAGVTANTRGTNALAGYHEALGANTNADVALKQATQPGLIAATNAKNKTTLSDEEIKQLENSGDLYRQAAAAAALETTPWGQAAAVKKVLGDHVKQGPEFDQFLASHGQNLPQYMADLGNNIYGASRAARTAAMSSAAHQKTVETQTQSQQEVAKTQAASRENVAATAAAAKVQGVHDKAEMDMKNRGAALATQAQREPDPAKRATLLQQADQANAFAAYYAKINAQTKNETGLAVSNLVPGTTPPNEPQPSLATPAATPQPVQPAVAPGQEVGKPVNTQGNQSPTDMIKKAFGEYNPDVYEYRINPQTGQPQRKKK